MGLSNRDNKQMLIVKILCLSHLVALCFAQQEPPGDSQANELQILAINNDRPTISSSLLGEQQKALQVIVNDLQEPIAAYQQMNHHNQIYPNPSQNSNQPKQQQQQVQPLGRGVINGNHATYVEPPADFKPIIYDYDRTQQLHRQQVAGSQLPTSDVSDALNQLIGSGSLSGQQQQQQQQQEQQVASSVMPNFLDPLSMSSLQQASNSPTDDSSQQMRQVLSHRLEPNRSSIGQEQNLQADATDNVRLADKAASVASQQHVLKPSIGRWSDWHDMSVEPDLASSESGSLDQTPTGNLYIATPNGVKLPFWTYRTRYRQPIGATKGATMAIVPKGTDGTKVGRRVSVKNEQQVFQIKRVQQHQHQQLAAAPSKLPLNDQSSSSIVKQPQLTRRNEANNINANGNKDNDNQWPATNFAAGGGGDGLVEAGGKTPGQQTPSVRPQIRRQKRRKSKSNAEVRIKQLVADSQLQQQQRQQKGMMQLKQVNLSYLDGHQPQPQQQHQFDQVQVNPQVIQRPSIIVKRIGSPAMNQAGQRPRVIKRRRVKTQLPVGLTSWFLGGIRDLDGRHWQLPNEVISRLAVNDVDLAGGPAPSSLPHKPAAGSVVIVDPVTSIPVAPVVRVPISQQIPR